MEASQSNPATPITWSRSYAELFAGRWHGARRWAVEASLIIGGSALLALSAQIALPIGPVPVTLQTLAVLIIGATFGARRAVACVLLYLCEGALGLPVFAAGGAGVARLLGPTAGYLWAFPVAAALVGFLVQRGWDRRRGTALAALLAADLIILGCGVAWLSPTLGWSAALKAGFLPFVWWNGMKLLLAAATLPAARRLVDELVASGG
ncbi:MAG: biotin transporter BioY [Phycisphaerae bacterium]|nr:biotin transporter BioY [Phycisphaerae bacterium]